MRRALLLVVAMVAFLAGAAAGYYFGYDIGFEKASALWRMKSYTLRAPPGPQTQLPEAEHGASAFL